MIIQFSHNGPELNLSKRSAKNGKAYEFTTPTASAGIRFWNNEASHKRKFIKSHGWYLENTGNSFDPIPKAGELSFWGEWEPQSRFVLTGNKYSRTPSLLHAVHNPIFSTHGIGKHNTDPFVFGEHFYYTNCKQGTFTFLRRLTNDSIIIFGSYKNRKDFMIDSVFVVGNSESVHDYRISPTDYPSVLRQATIDLHDGLPNHYKLYQGKMYDFGSHYSVENPYTFCFVPCIIDCDCKGFERPVIDPVKFNLQKPGAGMATKRIDYKSETDFWNELVYDILDKGFSLGIKFKMPPIDNTLEFPEYEKSGTKCGRGC
ncbi:hypothetical protein SAMN05216357_13317 [Porphyromonadaceae bacterium KH3CP3RA]|nr:hypothetical protein SAMN05216357_13317 [Porphyromonadaceae bacterium KH3CP3RA]